ncbi:hypothetical protein V491_09470 [Pseudogymnoascus sp. VKM F-3775]|nr:hypothetical protein V491_09470 [Pseudogymnoascus sp. VKM F-3775]
MAVSTGKIDVAGIQGVILDIEGTICPISFVKDVLFPYALESLPGVLETSWDSPSFATFRDAFPAEHRGSPAALLSHVQDLMAKDVKIAYLKSLQGHLWLTGYQSGALRCPLFPDVAPAIRQWHAQGKKVLIYSSGSVAAQKLLLQYTTETENDGDLREFIEGWYDTVNAGMKNEESSYQKILDEERKKGVEINAGAWVFFSDNVKEVEAADKAGIKTVLTVRPGNAEVSSGEKEKYRVAERFDIVNFA